MREESGSIIVRNIPEDHEQFVVARYSDHELWFWGSWSDKKAAEKVIDQIENSILVEM